MASGEERGGSPQPAGPGSGTTNPALDLLLNRRSIPAALLREPGPDPAQLDLMIAAATRVPDHGSLRPWRFLVYRGAARERVGLALAALAEQLSGPLSAGQVAKERNRFTRAPLVVGVVCSPRPSGRVPEAEMLLSAGAAALALSLAGNALGFGTCWVTNWYSNTPAGRNLLGLAPQERVAGFIHIGTPASQPPQRARPGHADLVADYTGPWSVTSAELPES